MISNGDLFVYGSLAILDVYVFWTLYRANKAITRYQGLMDRISAFLGRFEDEKTMRKTVRQIFSAEIKKLHDIMDTAAVYSDPRVMSKILENAIVNFLAHIGAKDLKELGMKKEQIAKITMAKNGLQAAGNLAAEGAGLNQLIGNVAGEIPQGEDGKLDYGQLIMRYMLGRFTGGDQQQKPKQVGGGGTIG